MKHISDSMQRPDRFLSRPPTFQERNDVRCIAQASAEPICLTAKELGASGYREVPGADGVRVGQFGLCRDRAGEWVYPPLKKADETLEDMLWRNAEARRRMDICPRKRDAGKLRGFDDE